MKKSIIIQELVHKDLEKMIGHNGCTSFEDVIEFLLKEYKKHEEFKVIKECVGEIKK